MRLQATLVAAVAAAIAFVFLSLPAPTCASRDEEDQVVLGVEPEPPDADENPERQFLAPTVGDPVPLNATPIPASFAEMGTSSTAAGRQTAGAGSSAFFSEIRLHVQSVNTSAKEEELVCDREYTVTNHYSKGKGEVCAQKRKVADIRKSGWEYYAGSQCAGVKDPFGKKCSCCKKWVGYTLAADEKCQEKSEGTCHQTSSCDLAGPIDSAYCATGGKCYCAKGYCALGGYCVKTEANGELDEAAAKKANRIQLSWEYDRHTPLTDCEGVEDGYEYRQSDLLCGATFGKIGYKSRCCRRKIGEDLQDCVKHTGGSCGSFACGESRAATCENGFCMCDSGFCAKNGMCVQAPEATEANETLGKKRKESSGPKGKKKNLKGKQEVPQGAGAVGQEEVGGGGGGGSNTMVMLAGAFVVLVLLVGGAGAMFMLSSGGGN